MVLVRLALSLTDFQFKDYHDNIPRQWSEENKEINTSSLSIGQERPGWQMTCVPSRQPGPCVYVRAQRFWGLKEEIAGK